MPPHVEVCEADLVAVLIDVSWRPLRPLPQGDPGAPRARSRSGCGPADEAELMAPLAPVVRLDEHKTDN